MSVPPRKHYRRPSGHSPPRPVKGDLGSGAYGWQDHLRTNSPYGQERVEREAEQARTNERIRRALMKHAPEPTLMEKLETLAEKGATEGERNAAQAAIDRITRKRDSEK